MYYLTTLLLFLVGYTATLAQPPTAYIQEIGFEQGIPSLSISCILQNHQGFIWIGTSDNGVLRYDGISFKSYTKSTYNLSYNAVLNLAEDNKGNIWILTGSQGEGMRAIDVLEISSGTIKSLSDYLGLTTLPFDINTIYKIKQNIDRSIWLFGDNNLLYEYKEQLTLLGRCPNKGKALKLSDQLACYHYLITDSLTNLNNSSGLALLEWKNQQLTLIPDSIPKDFHLAPFAIAPPNIIYIEKLEQNHSTFYKKEGKKPLQKLFERPRTESKWYHRAPYFYVIKEKRLEILKEQNGELVQTIPLDINKSTSEAYLDQQGGIWIATTTSLFHVIPFVNPFNWKQAFSKKTNAPYPSRGIITHNNKVYYSFVSLLATSDTLMKLFSNGHLIYGMANSNKGDLLLALDHSGVLNYNTQKDSFHLYQLLDSGLSNVRLIFWQPYEDATDQLWVGSSKGLFYVDKQDNCIKKWQGYGSYNELPNSAVYFFYENEKGCWLCTSSGLYLLNKNKTKVLKHFHSNATTPALHLPYNHLTHLYEDTDGSFWLSSKGGGLIHWNPSTQQSHSYTKEEGLSHNVIYAVYPDTFGNLWLPSNKGLMRFNKKTTLVNTYMPEDGLPHHEFNTIAHHQDSTGRLYFGTIKGSISFHPKDLQQPHQGQDIQLTNVYRQDWKDESKDITFEVIKSQTLLLPPQTKEFEIHFALLDYRKTRNNRYAYKIEGYDQDWHYITTPVITMNTLPYGNYTLRFRAQASGSNWQEAHFTLKIIVTSPFYLQWWFFILIAITTGLLIYSIFKWRLKTLKERQIELEKIVVQRTAKIAKDKALIEEQAAELKALDNVKSRFFANISHELRTPLTLILGPLSYILDNSKAWDERNIRHQLAIMQRSGKNLLQLIEEILDLSKLDANKLELVEEPIHVEQFFEHLFAVFKPQLQAQQLDYDLIISLKQEQLYCLIDKQKIRKVVNNFLSNALKYTPRKGKITLTVIEQPNTLLIQVTDTGKGVHPKDLPYIFDRFYQSKQEDQVAYGGTGIGLALVSEFAQLMKGKAYAESALGVGSQFYFEFPKKLTLKHNIIKNTKQYLHSLEDDLIEDIGSDFTILLVEDNTDMRNFVSELLRQRYTVLTANNGLEGLEQLQKHQDQIDLVISDVMMPELDGLGLLKAIKSNPKGNTLPVIMLTALAAEQDKLKALTTGVDDYLTKPFSANELLVRVQNLLYNYHQRQLVQKEVLSENAAIKEKPKENNPLKEEHIQNNEWIKEVEQIVLESIPKHILSVEDLAFQVHLSSRQLNRRIKLITGLTPAKFIKEIQLQLARKELESGRFMSVAEVAYNTGFELPNTFSKVFKKRFGKSPKEYLD